MPGSGRLNGRGPLPGRAPVQVLLRSSAQPVLRFRVAALMAAQLFDFGTFKLMVDEHGIVAEANPVVSQGFAAFGLPMLLVTKIALVVLLGSIVVLLSRDRPSRRSIPGLAAAIAVLAVIGGLAGGISNVLAT